MAERGQQRLTPLDAASKQLQQILSGVASLLATSWLAARMRPLLASETPAKRRYIRHTHWRRRQDGSLTYLCLTEEEMALSAVEKEQDPADYVLYLMYNLTSLESLRQARKFLRVAQRVESRPDDIVLQNVYGYDLPWPSMRHAVFRYNVMYLLLRLRNCEREKREALAKQRQVKALRAATSKAPSELKKPKLGLLPAAVPSSPLSPNLGYRVVTVVTTAALPWLTGTSINPLLRAAYLERLEHVKVNLMIPWLEAPDQRIVYPRDLVFPTPAAQEQHIREWLLTRLNLDVHFRIVFYPARFDLEKYSIFPAGGFDLTALIPPAEADVAVLEEPEHLCWYHFGPKWRQVFRLVVGIIHTNYYEYVRRQPVDKGGGPVLAFLLWYVNVWRTRANCHLAIRLSEGVQFYADATVCNVHGVGPQFLTVHQHLRPSHRSMNGSAPNSAMRKSNTDSGAQTSETRSESAGSAPDSARNASDAAENAPDSAGNAPDVARNVPEPAGEAPPRVSVEIADDETGLRGGTGRGLAAEPAGVSGADDVDRSADDVTLKGGSERAKSGAAEEMSEGDEEPLVFDKGCYFIGKMLWAKGYRELCDLVFNHCKRQRGEDPEPPVAKQRRLLKVPFRLRRVETKSRGGTGRYRREQKIGVEAMKQFSGSVLQPAVVAVSGSNGPSERPRQEESGASREEVDVSKGEGDVADALDDVSERGDDVRRRGVGVSSSGNDVSRKGHSADGGEYDVRSADSEVQGVGADVEELRAFVEPYDSADSDEPDSPLSRARTDPGVSRGNDRTFHGAHDDATEWSRMGARPYSVKVRNGERQLPAARPVASTQGRGKRESRVAGKPFDGSRDRNGFIRPTIRPFVRADSDDASSDDGADVSRAGEKRHEREGVNGRERAGVSAHESADVSRTGVNARKSVGVNAPESIGTNGLGAESPVSRKPSVSMAHTNGFELDSPLKVRLSVGSATGGEGETERHCRLIAHETEGTAQLEQDGATLQARANGLEESDVAVTSAIQGRVNESEEAGVGLTSARDSGLDTGEAAARIALVTEGETRRVPARVNGLDVAVTSADVTGLDMGEAGRRSAVQVDCFGTGGEEDEIIEFARKNDLPVEFHGRCDHADASLWGYKVFVNPSCSDVLCTTTAEALAMGKFVVVADHPSNIFFAEHFPENTVLYDPDVPVEFSQAIQRALAGHPAPLTSAQRRMLTWEAATERFMRAAKLL